MHARFFEVSRAAPRAGRVRRSIFLLLLAGCAFPSIAFATAPVYGYEWVASYPHDTQAFTQGLIVEDEFFFEGTGLYGDSSLRKVELQTGVVVKQHDLSNEYFGEGITALRDTLYQITWANHEAFTYVEGDTLELIGTLPYAWEGWGLTHDGMHLIASDGSSTLRFLDPGTLAEVSQITVQDGDDEISELNELEYIQGRVYANVWYSDWIAVIDPSSGVVDAWLDLGGLRDSVAYYPSANVLNGIAFDPVTERLFVTGKRWPEIFEILVPTVEMDVDAHPALPPAQALALRCFPNPCGDRLALALQMPSEGSISLSLFDATGRSVYLPGGDRPAAGKDEILLDTSHLPMGIYFLRCVAAGGVGSEAIRVVR